MAAAGRETHEAQRNAVWQAHNLNYEEGQNQKNLINKQLQRQGIQLGWKALVHHQGRTRTFSLKKTLVYPKESEETPTSASGSQFTKKWGNCTVLRKVNTLTINNNVEIKRNNGLLTFILLNIWGLYLITN